MARLKREEAMRLHAEMFGHTDCFKEKVYGVLCEKCRNYIHIDRTNCPSTCTEHDTCVQAYA